MGNQRTDFIQELVGVIDERGRKYIENQLGRLPAAIVKKFPDDWEIITAYQTPVGQWVIVSHIGKLKATATAFYKWGPLDSGGQGWRLYMGDMVFWDR